MVSGFGEKETTGIPWRLRNDLSLVIYEKKIFPVCKLLHHLVTEKGIAEVDIVDHKLSPQLHDVT